MTSQQHQKPTSRRRHIPRTAKIMIGAGALLLAAVAAITASSTSGTLALWNDSADIPEASITVGSSKANLSISTGTQAAPEGTTDVAFPVTTWTNMLPGDVIGAPLTIKNFDSRPHDLAAAIDLPQSASGDLRFALAQGTCTPGPITGNVLTTTPAALSGQVLGANASKTYCLQVELSSNVAAAKQGTQITPSFAVTIYGK
ncbi:hypothetical protein G7068_07780 [Leucobacter viscericola]|uniref:SipW-cognate class signal peptide n=1 Tax=Leucobacter viscericola TaxID=2714935 RepID=A0A6G7XFG5_9MICO|nr:SipW-dependent-type signal peptide-containing protein [Leucobacter viscericola]QIK63111.1 hypothetical protein G7068_07780 [Leucobacter viscericola]